MTSTECLAWTDSFNYPDYLIMIKVSSKRCCNFFWPVVYYSMACFHRTACFLDQLQRTPSINDKKVMVQVFRDSLSDTERTHFNWLMEFVTKNMKVGLSSKLINKYYLKNCVPLIEQSAMERPLAEGKLPSIISSHNSESELTLLDMRVLLKYLAEAKGAGSQNTKTEKVIRLCSKISPI